MPNQLKTFEAARRLVVTEERASISFLQRSLQIGYNLAAFLLEELEAKGVIPPDTKWPEGGASVSWEAGKLEYSLSRTRPEGMKGPQKLWLAGDWWNLRFQLKVRPNQGARAIQKKAAELAAELHRQSAAGRRQRSLEWNAYWKTCEDKAFQAFKTKFIPERKKPGRPAKVRTADPAQGAQAS